MSSWKSNSSRSKIDPNGNTRLVNFSSPVNIYLTAELRQFLQEIERKNQEIVVPNFPENLSANPQCLEHFANMFQKLKSHNLGYPAMLELEDQLDYEPDGPEQEYDKQDEFQIRRYREVDKNREYFDPDNEEQSPEPSGQDDQISCHQNESGCSSERQSLNYGTDVEGLSTSSFNKSFRDKLNYCNLHLDVEEGSCRSKFIRHVFSKDSGNLDSSSEDEAQFSDPEFPDQNGSEDFDYVFDSQNNQNLDNYDLQSQPCESPRNATSYREENLENYVENNIDNYNSANIGKTYAEPNAEYSDGTNTYSSDMYENLVAPNEIMGESPLSNATTVKVPEKNPFTSAINFNKTPPFSSNGNLKNNNLKASTFLQSPAKKSGVKNFSIVVTGKNRLITNFSVVKKKHKPWATKLNDNHLLVKLTSSDKIIKYVPSGKSQGEIETASLGRQSSDNVSTCSGFKIPLKRPPTRQKPSNNLSVSVDLMSCKKRVTPVAKLPSPRANQDEAHNQDDIISLIASTNIDELDEERNTLLIKDEPSSLVSGATQKFKMNRVSVWLQDIEPNENQPKGIATQWGNVPICYKGLCFSYFFDNHCKYKSLCRNMHGITRIGKLDELSTCELMEAYEFAKSIPIFYGKIYKEFAKVFAIHGWRKELVEMVQIIFEDNLYKIQEVDGLNEVINNLEKTDLSFTDSVEFVLIQIGLSRYPKIGSVLFDLISQKKDSAKYWPIMRRLILTGDAIPVNIGIRFMENLMKEPVDVEVCKKAYQHLLRYKVIDFSQIPREIIQTFKKIAEGEEGSRPPTLSIQATIEKNLSKLRDNVERENPRNPTFTTKPNKQILSSNFSVPPPNFTDFKTTKPNIVFNSPISFNNPVPRPNQLSATLPPADFGSLNSTQENQDFASLSRQQKSFAPNQSNFSTPPPNMQPNPPNFRITPPNFDVTPSNLNITPPRGMAGGVSQNNVGFKDIDERYRPQRYHKSSCGSSEEESPNYTRFSDTDSSVDQNPSFPRPNPSNSDASLKKRPPAGLTYNREGLRYDPINDYAPPTKRRSTEAPPGPLTRKASPVAELVFEEAEPVASGSNQINEKAGRAPLLLRRSGRVKEVEPARQRTGEGRGKSNGSEEGVSSSTDAKQIEQKPPEHPKYGKMYFDPNYEFNVSLHNLYLQQIDNVDINEDDVLKLNACIKSGDGKTFLELVEKYKGPPTVQNFISMTLAHLKGMNQMVARIYLALLASVERANPKFYGNLNIRVIFEVITMNLLFELEKRNMFDQATILLEKFSDWDSLITSRLFINRSVSVIGRYLFIARLLVSSKPELTYEILICSRLHLLEEYDKWPYHPSCPILEISNSDKNFRNIVLLKFLKEGYLRNKIVVSQLFKTAFKKKIWEFDVAPYFDKMIVTLINQKSSLKHIHADIDLFASHMEKDTLRGFLCSMYPNLSKQDAFRLFEKCIERGIYQRLVIRGAMEYILQIKTNTLNQEIELLILYYFHKLSEIKNLPPGSASLRFEIKLPGDLNRNAPNILSSNRSLIKINEVLIMFLKKLCLLDANSIAPSVVEVGKEQLVSYLNRNRL